jgi:hypothetical protein
MSMAEKVRKLAALAGSDNEHEANAAARQACRLIREGKVTIDESGRGKAPRNERAHVRHDWGHWPPPKPPPRPVPTGPFARRPDIHAVPCWVCREELQRGDAFSCSGGYVHGDCIPRDQRP